MAFTVVEHDPRWCAAFLCEQAALQVALGANAEAIHHIGSTAIPGILAKPVIDILCVARALDTIDATGPRLQSLGYDAKGTHGIAGRRYFQKSGSDGVRSHHLHIYETGSPRIAWHLAFRDFLLAHPAKAQEYSELKAAIVAAAPSKAQYQDRKAAFVDGTAAAALDWQDSRRTFSAPSSRRR